MKRLNTQSKGMDLHSAMVGYGLNAAARLDGLRSAVRLVQAITRLDTEVARSPARLPWLRVQAEAGLATAAKEAGGIASLEDILCARIGAGPLPRDHLAMSDLDARANMWREVAQRKGPAHLRKLVTRLVPDRRELDLFAVAGRIAEALGDCVSSNWYWDGGTTITLDPSPLEQPDAGDLALALPYALRRAGLARQVLPGLTGRPRAFARKGDPLQLTGLWLASLQSQVEEGAARLRQLERHIAGAEMKLLQLRRPAALRRLAALSLGSWGVWAAQFARVTRVDVSTAWRTLEQGAEIGLVVPVSTGRRSRGDAQLYAAPVWMKMAGLISNPRGRPAKAPPLERPRDSELADAIAILDDAIASTDKLLNRSR